MDRVPGWPTAFRGSAAVAAGLTTWDVLFGPRYLRPFPDTYLPAGDGPPDLLTRSHAAYRYVEGHGVLAGYSAAEVLGASCGRPDEAAEVIVCGRRQRGHPGLLVRRDRIEACDVAEVGGLRVTAPLITAFDLARRGDLVRRVVAVDALANAHRFDPRLLADVATGRRGARGLAGLPEVLALADRRSGSPMETRLRLVIVCAGLPPPEVQWAVQDTRARTAVWLDLAYPEQLIGVEYDGAVHTDPEAVLRDIGRHTALLDQGWRVYRYTKHDVLRRPDKIVTQLARALGRRDVQDRGSVRVRAR